MRKDGYYWVKEQGEWEIAYYGLLGWTWIAMEQFGYDPLVVHEDEDTPFDEVGPRIPFPDGEHNITTIFLGGGYGWEAHVEGFPDLVSYGETEDEAISLAKDALEATLEYLFEKGE